MALFPGNPDDAVKAGFAMLKQLEEYNKEREQNGDIPIKIGVGINTGGAMLGTVGEANRMEGTVISDAVNLASRIEGLTKNYKTPLLISEYTLNKLKNPKQYNTRFVDRVNVKGKAEAVSIYEVADF